ncbi:hypothetical protein M8312_05180 [Sphingomonas sp. KRR8]|uniref:hypothetical protein n=1 Tax=Sphingomonas sp. KRR8 TaxID=2942996 RepID=UPI00201FCC61|nr:hypothetical protein [Sphingomonas sp. KRR8]URD61903.1 hypothetical protein M8312_05180 [Sphingomonas sp. KRR8]
MANDLNSGLVGLTLLGGAAADSMTSAVAATVQTRAARLAKAQFTTPVIAPPWKVAGSGTPESVAAIQRLKSIVDQVQTTASLPPDLQTAFSAYKALERLRMLAEYATRNTTSSAVRTQLQTSFAKGVADLQRYLAVAPSSHLSLTFGQPKTRVDSFALPSVNPANVSGKAVTTDRYAPVPGLNGNEHLTLGLRRPGATDSLSVDLNQTAQPPTLDSVANALNAAIASIPRLDSSGAPVLDPNGNVRPRWDTKFAVVKGDKGWGLELQTMGVEQVSLSDESATDALIVAASQSVPGSPGSVALTRFDLPDQLLTRASLGTLSAFDRQATAAQQTLPARKSANGINVIASPVAAALTARAVVSDAQGFSYVVGTTSGDTGVQRGDGAEDLLLSKVDAQGSVIWQRSLGSGGSAQGTAVALAPDGDVVVGGTSTGDLDGASTDGDMMVIRFSADGHERFATAVRSAGADLATAISVAANGDTIIGGKSADGSAMLARFDVAGKLVERHTLGNAGSEIRALASAPDGSSVALMAGPDCASLLRLDAGSLGSSAQVALGNFDGSSLAISASGSIAVGGAITAGDRNGQVVQLSSDLSVIATTVLASGGDDRVDSITFIDGTLYAGGRTSGSIGAAKSGSVDGFVARIGADGALQQISQWGRSGTEIGPVEVSAAPGADSAASALGFRSGLLNPPESPTLVDRTALRTGDSFSFRVDGGTAKTVTITATDTLASLADRMGKLAGKDVTVSAAPSSGASMLRISAKPGHSIDLSAGPTGHDALAKLALEPGRLVTPPAYDPKAPRVTPGGSYGLDLTTGLSIGDSNLAAASLARIKTAIRTTQTAYRSLYWDNSKEALVNGNGGSNGIVSAYQSSQLARYKDALTRLTGTLTSSSR